MREHLKNPAIIRWYSSFSRLLGTVYVTLLLMFFYILLGFVAPFVRFFFVLEERKKAKKGTYWIDRTQL